MKLAFSGQKHVTQGKVSRPFWRTKFCWKCQSLFWPIIFKKIPTIWSNFLTFGVETREFNDIEEFLIVTFEWRFFHIFFWTVSDFLRVYFVWVYHLLNIYAENIYAENIYLGTNGKYIYYVDKRSFKIYKLQIIINVDVLKLYF